MLPKQATLLQSQGELLLSQSADASANEAIKLTELAMKCFSESREIVSTLGQNSVSLWVEFAVNVEINMKNYPIYCEFCSRNGFVTLNKEDYERFLEGLLEV